MHLREALGDLVDRGLGLAADADHEFVLAGEIGQCLVHIGVVDVLDHLHLDLFAVLLLRGHQAVIGRLHPAFVGLRTGDQDADGEDIGSVGDRSKRCGKCECSSEQRTLQDQTTCRHERPRASGLGRGNCLRRASEQATCQIYKCMYLRDISEANPPRNKQMLTFYPGCLSNCRIPEQRPIAKSDRC